MVKGRVMAIIGSLMVVCLTAGFLLYALSLKQDLNGKETSFHAIFMSANGLSEGADVDLGGVKIGSVRSITLDTQNAIADVVFTIRENISLPEDTEIEIGAASMTGDNVLKIRPGHQKIFLKQNARITNTRPLLSLEQQISNYIFNTGKL